MHEVNPAGSPLRLTPTLGAEILANVASRPSYNSWTTIIPALAFVFPDNEASLVLTQWSPAATPGDCTRKIRHRLTKIGIGSLISLPKQHRFSSPSGVAQAALDLELV